MPPIYYAKVEKATDKVVTVQQCNDKKPAPPPEHDGIEVIEITEADYEKTFKRFDRVYKIKKKAKPEKSNVDDTEVKVLPPKEPSRWHDPQYDNPPDANLPLVEV